MHTRSDQGLDHDVAHGLLSFTDLLSPDGRQRSHPGALNPADSERQHGLQPEATELGTILDVKILLVLEGESEARRNSVAQEGAN